ncbi:unnamed protein product [Haemonchus placei]|uniref:Uncharacterized protein n=1 Tax=Haemonchus placei TaxID=6290 RepID=A0A0N4W2I7_HAEPC|nr:unnamed protein product [Haemonchus placei]
MAWQSNQKVGTKGRVMRRVMTLRSHMVQEFQANETKQNQAPPALAHDDDDFEGDWEVRSEYGAEEASEDVKPRGESDRVVEVVRPEQRLNPS